MKTKILILGLLALGMASAKKSAPVAGPSAILEKAAPNGPSFSFRQKMDTGEVKGKQVIIPAEMLFTWNDGKGKEITWDAGTGVVVKGDSGVTFADFRFMAGFFLGKIQEEGAFKRSSDSAVSASLERAWSILNPRR